MDIWDSGWGAPCLANASDWDLDNIASGFIKTLKFRAKMAGEPLTANEANSYYVEFRMMLDDVRARDQGPGGCG